MGGRRGADPAEAMVHDITRVLVMRERLEQRQYAAAVTVLGTERLVALVVLCGSDATLALMLDVFDVGAPQS